MTSEQHKLNEYIYSVLDKYIKHNIATKSHSKIYKLLTYITEDCHNLLEINILNYVLVRIDDMKDKKLVVYSMQINDTNLIPKIIDRIKDLNETIEINAINNSTL